MGLSIGHMYLSGIVYLTCVFEWGCLLGTCIGVGLSNSHMYLWDCLYGMCFLNLVFYCACVFECVVYLCMCI